jgi:hypothetical protein
LIELDSEREIHAAKESLAQISSEPKKILRKSHTTTCAAEAETAAETDSSEIHSPSNLLLPRSSSLPISQRRTSLALPVINDADEDDEEYGLGQGDGEAEGEEDQEEARKGKPSGGVTQDHLPREPILKIFKRSNDNGRPNSSPLPLPVSVPSEPETTSSRRPSSSSSRASSRKRTTAAVTATAGGVCAGGQPSMKPPQPPVSKGTKSPRKMSFQDHNLSPPVPAAAALPVPVVTTVDTSTSIDLNLTRLSRIHRFIQTDMYSTEYGGLVNQVADLTTELEEKEKLIATLQKDNLVLLSSLLSLFLSPLTSLHYSYSCHCYCVGP